VLLHLKLDGCLSKHPVVVVALVVVAVALVVAEALVVAVLPLLAFLQFLIFLFFSSLHYIKLFSKCLFAAC